MFNSITLSEANFKLSAVPSGELLALILLAIFGIFSSVEFIFPRRKLPLKPLRLSYKTNISLFIFNSAFMSVLSASSLFAIAQLYSHQGMLRYLSNPALQAILSFLMLDLMLYFWHKACHRFNCLWMFHRVHHNDPCLNTSTAFRIHILELILTSLLKAVYIVVMGIDQMVVLANEAIITIFVMFHHSNISFRGEKLLGRVIIVPYLHRSHHSTQRNEHDSNYGAVLSLWDRLFGTLIEQKPVAIGITESSPQDVINLIKFGFNLPTQPETKALPANLEHMIAEAAYYRAEKRNFNPGYELLDWLEAKKDIIKQVYRDNAAGINKKPQRNGVLMNFVLKHWTHQPTY